MKRKDECIACKSRGCYERVVSSEDNGRVYDEVACVEHVQNLRSDSDIKAFGVLKHFISSTGRQQRGMEFHA